MRIRVYFTEEASKRIYQSIIQKGGNKPNYYYNKEIKALVIYDQRNERCYAEVDTIFSFSLIPSDWIERATLIDRLFAQDEFRSSGIYRWRKGVLEIRTSCIEERLKSEICLYQTIQASASDISTLESLYSLVRQGKLLPKENWGRKGIKDKIKQFFRKLF